MPNKLSKISILFLIIFGSILMGCGEDPNRPLTRTEKKYVDSILVVHKKTWSPYYDSICDLRQAKLVDHLYDSLLQAEIKSIQKLEQ